MKIFLRVCALVCALAVSVAVQAQTKPVKPLPVRVVVVTTFELG